MKIKISTSPYVYLITFLIMFDGEFFSILPFSFINQTSFQTVVILGISLLLLLNTFINKKIRETIKPYSGYAILFMVVLVIVLILQGFYSYSAYSQSIQDVIYAASISFSRILLIFPIIYLLCRPDGFTKLMNTITIITVIVLLIRTFRAIVYNTFGYDILSHLGVALRSDRMRLGLISVAGIAFIYICYRFLTSKRNTYQQLLFLALILFFAFYEYYTNMTRMYIISFLATFIMMLVTKKRPVNKEIVLISCLLIIFVALLASGAITQFMSTFSTEGDIGGSTVSRQNTLKYFNQVVKEQPFFGLGLLIPKGTNYYIFFGPNGSAYLDDVGIINMFYHYGILGLILVVMVFGRMLYVAVRLFFCCEYEKRIFVIGGLTYLAITSISLSAFDSQRMLSLVILWAVFEHDYYSYYLNPRKYAKASITPHETGEVLSNG